MKNGIEPKEVLTKLFGSISRARILSFLYAHAGQSFYQREIMYETGLSLRPVQRELDNLVDLGILKRRVVFGCCVYTFHKGKSASVARKRGQATFWVSLNYVVHLVT